MNSSTVVPFKEGGESSDSEDMEVDVVPPGVTVKQPSEKMSAVSKPVKAAKSLEGPSAVSSPHTKVIKSATAAAEGSSSSGTAAEQEQAKQNSVVLHAKH